jgi:hypothetical protein
MAARVYLHIGTMKSATTYLQLLCDENSDELATVGTLWLGTSQNFRDIGDFFNPPDESRGRASSWPDFLEQVRAHDGDVVISNELISTRSAGKISSLVKAFGNADVQVIVTARDLGRVIPSQWQSRSLNHVDLHWRPFIDRLVAEGSEQDLALRWFWRRQDLPTIIDGVVGVVGADNVTLVTVPPSGSDPTLLAERFLSAIGISTSPNLRQPQHQHLSLGAHSVEFLRRVREHASDSENERLHVLMKYVLARRVLSSRRAVEPVVGLNAVQLEWARARAAEMIQKLRDAKVQVVGSLDDLIPGEPPAADLADPQASTEAELLDVALDTVIGLLEVLE